MKKIGVKRVFFYLALIDNLVLLTELHPCLGEGEWKELEGLQFSCFHPFHPPCFHSKHALSVCVCKVESSHQQLTWNGKVHESSDFLSKNVTTLESSRSAKEQKLSHGTRLSACVQKISSQLVVVLISRTELMRRRSTCM